MKLRLLTIGVFLTSPMALHAQDAAQEAPTLQVYANLVQVPVFALVPGYPPVSQLHFAVSLDSGPPFPTSRIRLERNDPITLAILLDVSNGQQKHFDSGFSAAVAAMAQQELRPADRVSIYSMDCQPVRTADNIPADPEKLEHAVDEAIQSPEAHRSGKTRLTCANAPFLWDSIAYLSDQLTLHSGRRVILAITDGHDVGSNHKLAELRDFVNMSAVAIFGLSIFPRSTPSFANQSSEEAFSNLSQMSGGWVYSIGYSELPHYLHIITWDIRGRYIVEFLRPNSLTPGPHSIVVTIVAPNNISIPEAFVRPAGLSLPIADPTVLADPNTVPADPSNAPTLGDRRILTKPH